MTEAQGQYQIAEYTAISKVLGPDISFEDLINRFLNDGRLRGISQYTIRTYESHIKPLVVFSKIRSLSIMAMTQNDLPRF